MPLPTTTALSPEIDPQPSDRVQRHRHRLDQRRMLERQIARHRINRLLRHDDVLGKRPLLTELVAGDAENPPPRAHVRLARCGTTRTRRTTSSESSAT